MIRHIHLPRHERTDFPATRPERNGNRFQPYMISASATAALHCFPAGLSTLEVACERLQHFPVIAGPHGARCRRPFTNCPCDWMRGALGPRVFAIRGAFGPRVFALGFRCPCDTYFPRRGRLRRTLHLLPSQVVVATASTDSPSALSRGRGSYGWEVRAVAQSPAFCSGRGTPAQPSPDAQPQGCPQPGAKKSVAARHSPPCKPPAIRGEGDFPLLPFWKRGERGRARGCSSASWGCIQGART